MMTRSGIIFDLKRMAWSGVGYMEMIFPRTGNKRT